MLTCMFARAASAQQPKEPIVTPLRFTENSPVAMAKPHIAARGRRFFPAEGL